MSKIPAISVAIPTYNREEVLVNTINDVLSGQSFEDFELIIVDQTIKHTEETERFINSITDKRFRYFRTTPPSVTVARNFAMQKALAPYIIFLDDDVILDKDLVKNFLETFLYKPDISAVAGRVLQDGFPVLDTLHFDDYMISHGGFTSNNAGYTNAFPGGNCAIKVQEALAIGGFDTRYKGNAFREESDMSIRMSKLGYKIYFNPKAKLTHLAAPYGGNRVKTHIYDSPAFYKNELFFTLRFVKKGKRIEALRKKYHEYCLVVRHKQAYRRRYYFFKAIPVAIWRLTFNKQLVAKELI